jgi:ribosome biogenesis protein
VRFFSKYEKFRITDAPFAVPSKLGRYGLSEVVNHLLDSNDSPQPFDFAINGRLVRVSLKKFVVANRISTEDVITIEYMPAISISDESESAEVPAWIGCIETKVDGLVVAGCYDGKIQIVNKNGLEIVSAVAGHDEPIRAITSWKSSQNLSSILVATASKDHSLKCWSLNSQKSKNMKDSQQLVLAANLVVRTDDLLLTTNIEHMFATLIICRQHRPSTNN